LTTSDADGLKEIAAAAALAEAAEAVASARAREPGAVYELLDSLEQDVFNIAADLRSPPPPRSLNAVLEDALDGRGDEGSVSTGIEELDALLGGGWRPGTVNVIAGSTVGISKLALCFSVAAANVDIPTLLCCPGHRGEYIAWQLVERSAGVDSYRVRAGNLTADEQSGLSAARKVLAELPLFIDDDPHSTVQDIRLSCRRLKAEQGLGLVMVDDVGLVARNTDTAPLPVKRKSLRLDCHHFWFNSSYVSEYDGGNGVGFNLWRAPWEGRKQWNI
jgi:replicative DNA helicase